MILYSYSTYAYNEGEQSLESDTHLISCELHELEEFVKRSEREYFIFHDLNTTNPFRYGEFSGMYDFCHKSKLPLVIGFLTLDLAETFAEMYEDEKLHELDTISEDQLTDFLQGLINEAKVMGANPNKLDLPPPIDE